MTEEEEVTVERKHPKARCEACPWSEHKGFADARGPEEGSVLIVGEAPGAQEVESGEPFVGPSGKLLDKVLAHHGFDYDQVRFTNVVACHPPFSPGKGSTAPPKEVIACCRPRLRDELRDRDTIICLGNTAKEAVLETREAITKVRQGPPRSNPSYPNASIVATVHPAACLRSSDFFPSLVKDLKKAKDPSIYVGWEPPIFKVFDEPREAAQALKELQPTVHRGPLTVDIECGVEKDVAFSHPDVLLCVGLGYAPNKAIVIGEEALKSEQVRSLLASSITGRDLEDPVVCHNGKFDLQVLMRLGILDRPNLGADTMLMSYCLDERPGHHGLKGLASEILGAPDYGAEIGKHISKGESYAKVPRPVLYQYNAYDAALTYNLYTHFEKELREAKLTHVHDRLVWYSNELVYLELDGVKVDIPYLDTLDEEYAVVLKGLETELSEWVGNPRSPQQVKASLQSLGMRPQDTTADTLKFLQEKHSKKPESEQARFLDTMLRYRREQKLHSTYIRGPRKRLLGDRVYPTYMLHGSVTGRLAARNPNMQNIPREGKIRKLYIPEEGNVFVQADYGQIELRVAAAYARDVYLQGVFQDPDRDIHGEIADQLYGAGNWGKEERVRAKAVVFGSLYDREAPGIAKEYGMSLNEAQALQNTFFRQMPELTHWRETVKDKVFKGGQALQTDFGRKRRFWLITKQNKMDIGKEALAFLPQSTANDITLSALVELRRAFGSTKTGPRVRIPVHDSIMVECKQSEAKEVAEHMTTTMERVAKEQFSDFVPFVADAEVGKSWGELVEMS